MRKDKEAVIKLRKSGKSYREIKKILGVPMSTLSGWLGKMKWSTSIQADLNRKARIKHILRLKTLNNIRGDNLRLLYEEARIEAKNDFEILKYNPLFISAVSIYWGEGDKASRNGFRVANTDPKMLKLFIDFLVSICLIDKKKIRAWVLLYPDLDESVCKSYWKANLGLKDANFWKSIIISGSSKKPKKLTYGVGYVHYSSRYLKEKMLVWIDMLSKIAAMV